MRGRRGATVGVLLCGSAVVLGSVSVPGAAQAACAYDSSPTTLRQRGRLADTVFVGTATGGSGSRVEVRVSDVYKGRVPQQLVLDGGRSGTPDTVTFVADRQYLVLADRDGARYTTDACLGSTPVGDDVISAAEDAFGMPTSFRPTAPPDETEPATSTSNPPPAPPTDQATPATASAEPPARASSSAKSHPVRSVLFGALVAAGLLGSFFLPRLRRRRGAEPSTGEPDPDGT